MLPTSPLPSNSETAAAHETLSCPFYLFRKHIRGCQKAFVHPSSPGGTRCSYYRFLFPADYIEYLEIQKSKNVYWSRYFVLKKLKKASNLPIKRTKNAKKCAQHIKNVLSTFKNVRKHVKCGHVLKVQKMCKNVI